MTVNKKLKDLAEKSGISFGGHPMNPLSVYPSELEKFAELIVKECARSISIEIDRLSEYQNSLEESEYSKRNDVDLCIEKCYDNMYTITKFFMELNNEQ